MAIDNSIPGPIGSLLAGAVVATLAGCGGDSGSSAAAPPPPSVLTAQLVDAPVQGLCYSAPATATIGTTSAGGEFDYVAGEAVTFWIDGSGATAGCTASTPGAATSVLLGTLVPSATSGETSSVLGLSGAGAATDVLAALNVGSLTAMSVVGLTIPAQTAADLDAYIASGGTTLPDADGGSVDTFLAASQAAITRGGAAPGFALPASAAASGAPSPFLAQAAQNLYDAATSLGVAPAAYAIGRGQLQFTVLSRFYTMGTRGDTVTSYATTDAQIEYYDGGGNVTLLKSPRGAAVTADTLADLELTGAYTTQPPYSSFGRSLDGVDLASGQSYTEVDDVSVDYQGSAAVIETGAYSESFTAPSVGQGGQFETGSFTAWSVTLTPLSISQLAGHTVQYTGSCDGTGRTATPITITFSAVQTSTTTSQQSLTATSSCTSVPMTLADSTITGIVQASDATGFLAWIGAGGGTAPASGTWLQFLVEAPGTGGNAASTSGWTVAGPFTGSS